MALTHDSGVYVPSPVKTVAPLMPLFSRFGRQTMCPLEIPIRNRVICLGNQSFRYQPRRTQAPTSGCGPCIGQYQRVEI
jgi:hypothetical protein